MGEHPGMNFPKPVTHREGSDSLPVTPTTPDVPMRTAGPGEDELFRDPFAEFTPSGR